MFLLQIKFNKDDKAFTLVEVLVALLILLIVISASVSVVNQALGATQNIRSKFIASELAQEGIELARNIRDGNWIENMESATSWDDGLPSGDWEIDYQSQSLSSYMGNNLKIDSNGFYNYLTGTETDFVRKITLEKKSDNQLRVISDIKWTEKGKDYNFTAIEDLYNWYAE